MLGLADAAEKGLLEHDKIVRNGPLVSNCRIVKSGESNTTRTIRTICKAFQKHGCEQAGAMAPFVKLTTSRGNRFNVLFWNAAWAIYHQQHFNSFFEVYGTPNNLLGAVQEDLDEIENIAGCRALGIIDKLVTGPYWRKYEAVENILDLNPVIEEMQRNCLQWSEDLPTLLFDQKPGFSDADIHKDNLHDALFQIQNDELDRLTLVALEIIMGYFCLTVARQMEEVLHGKLYNPSEELRNEVAMAPATNSVSERVFGSFDRYTREKPNATTLNLESTILFETNKTSSWLNGLDTSTKNLYLDIACKSAKGVIKNYQIGRKDIDERIRQNLLLKQKKAQEKERERDIK